MTNAIIYQKQTTPYGQTIVKILDGIVSFVPDDLANTDYQAYLAWVAEGNTAEEWQPDGE